LTWLTVVQLSPGTGLGQLVIGMPVLPDGTATAAHIGLIGAAIGITDLARAAKQIGGSASGYQSLRKVGDPDGQPEE